MIRTFTERVRRSFAKAAGQYDLLNALHKEIGRELVHKVAALNPALVLDVGCGTGYVTAKVKNLFPQNRVIGVDIAQGMIDQARSNHEDMAIEWMCADAAALPFTGGQVDMVISNLAYQWTDLPASFKEARRVLKEGGVLNITLFGGRTCHELMASVKAVDANARLRTLPSEYDVLAALNGAGFSGVKMSTELITVEFSDCMELLRWLKGIGANVLNEGPVWLGRSRLMQLEDHYRARYPYHDGIRASFEVIWVYANA